MGSIAKGPSEMWSRQWFYVILLCGALILAIYPLVFGNSTSYLRRLIWKDNTALKVSTFFISFFPQEIHQGGPDCQGNLFLIHTFSFFFFNERF